jgi:hypothetical protein
VYLACGGHSRLLVWLQIRLSLLALSLSRLIEEVLVHFFEDERFFDSYPAVVLDHELASSGPSISTIRALTRSA